MTEGGGEGGDGPGDAEGHDDIGGGAKALDGEELDVEEAHGDLDEAQRHSPAHLDGEQGLVENEILVVVDQRLILPYAAGEQADEVVDDDGDGKELSVAEKSAHTNPFRAERNHYHVPPR